METTKSLWNGFERLDFKFEDRDAILVLPEGEKCGKWLLKTEFFAAFPYLEIEMLKRGWCVAFVKNATLWGLDEDLDLKARFADFLSKEFGLYEKCVPVGMSCGGLIAARFAIKYPQYISCLYLDAPVLNLLSYPGGFGDAELSSDTEYIKFQTQAGITHTQLLSYREHPIDKVDVLLNNNIPVMMVAGDSDKVVPYHENGAILEKQYKEKGGCIKVIIKPGCDHHPHSLEDSSPSAEFILAHAE